MNLRRHRRQRQLEQQRWISNSSPFRRLSDLRRGEVRSLLREGAFGRYESVRFETYGVPLSALREGDVYEAITGHRSAVIDAADKERGWV